MRVCPCNRTSARLIFSRALSWCHHITMETTLQRAFSTSVEETIAAARVTTTRSLKLAFVDGGELRIPATAPKTLTEAFLRTSSHKDKGLTLVSASGEKEFINYADLHERARRMLSGLRDKGLGPGSRAI